MMPQGATIYLSLQRLAPAGGEARKELEKTCAEGDRELTMEGK
jgi:hypothetical protein